MAEKLNYQHAMLQICALTGWIDQARRQPDIYLEAGSVVVRTGPAQSIMLKTRESDVHASWDPMDGDKQVRARDALLVALKGMWLQPGSACMITPPMWETH